MLRPRISPQPPTNHHPLTTGPPSYPVLHVRRAHASSGRSRPANKVLAGGAAPVPKPQCSRKGCENAFAPAGPFGETGSPNICFLSQGGPPSAKRGTAYGQPGAHTRASEKKRKNQDSQSQRCLASIQAVQPVPSPTLSFLPSCRRHFSVYDLTS